MRERVRFVKPHGSLTTRIADWYVRAIVTVAKALVGAVLGLAFLAAAWLLWAILTLPKP